MITLYIKEKNKPNTIEIKDCINFRFIKERYTPYTTFSGEFLVESPLGEIVDISVSVDGTRIHHGLSDSICVKKDGNGYTLKISSRGYTVSTLLNQFTPGLLSNKTLNKIVLGELVLPNITCEFSSHPVPYIFVRENSSIWDAIVAYCLKGFNKYPFISGVNKVSFTPLNSVHRTISSNISILEYCENLDTTRLLSHIHMGDHLGNHGVYTGQSDFALEYGIVRHKYVKIDEQWLDAPQSAIAHRLGFSARGAKSKSVTLLGFFNIDITNKMTISTNMVNFAGEEVSMVEYYGNGDDFYSKIHFYDDEYSN